MPLPDADRFRTLLDHRPNTATLAAFVAGTALTLVFAPFGLWYLAPFLVLPVLLASFCGTPRQAARLSFGFGAGLFLCGTYWLYISIHVFGRAPLWIAIALMIALVVIMAAWYALLGFLCARLIQRDPRRLVFAAPAIWMLIEWLRGWFLSGFPWLTLGYSQLDSPLGGFVPVVGVYGVSFLLVLSASAALAAFFCERRWILIFVAVLPWVGGALLQRIAWTTPAAGALTVTVIQGGVSQDRKWQPEQFQTTLRLYRDGLLAAGDSDLVVWPEVAIPSVVDRVRPYIEMLQRDIRSRDQSLLLGVLEREADRVYNSMLLLDGTREQAYRKRHLVPFGEYFPVPDFVREWMRLMSLPNSDLSAGPERQPLLVTHSGQQLAVAICYEDAYGSEQLYALPEADLLVNVSNDAWFGDSIAPHQHLEIARVRAREAGRYVIRATNNGISALIGPRGELLAIAPQFEYAAMTFDVEPMRGTTPYARAGNWPIIILAFLLLGPLVFRRRR